MTLRVHKTSVARQLHNNKDHPNEPEFHSTKTTPYGKNQSLYHLDRRRRNRNTGGKVHVDGQAVLAFDAHHSRPTERLHRLKTRDVVLAYLRGHSRHHKGKMSGREISNPYDNATPVTGDSTFNIADAKHPVHSVPADTVHNASQYGHRASNYQTTAGETRDFAVENHGNPHHPGTMTSDATKDAPAVPTRAS